MAKILEFKKTDYTILKESLREAESELKKLYYLTGGLRFPTPPVLDDDLLQAFYDGVLEF